MYGNSYCYAELIAALSAQLEAATARIRELEECLDAAERSNRISDNGNLWRFWSDKSREIAARNTKLSAQLEAANKRADTAHAQGKAEGLREAAAQLECRYNIALKISDTDLLSDWKSHVASTWGQSFAMVHALTPADTPAAKVTVQEAAKVLIDAEVFNDMRAKHVITCEYHPLGLITASNIMRAALRAIAGGKDE